MRGMASRPVAPGFIAALAAFTVYLALLNNFLRFQQYPLLRLEVLYAVLVGAGSAILFGTIYQIAGLLPKWAARTIRSALVGGLIGYAVALVAGSVHALVAASVAAGLAFRLESRVLAPISLLAFATLLAATVGIGQQTEASAIRSGKSRPSAVSKPAIVHIIFDEQIGVQGLPDDNPGTPRLRQAIREFYLNHGFELFGGAYSQYFNTANSIPFVLNLEQGEMRTSGGFFGEAKANAYFKLLKSAGYRINVLQSDYIDYCSDLVELCTTYPSQNYASVAGAPLSSADKAMLIQRKMIPNRLLYALSDVYLWLYDAGYRLPVAVPDMNVSPNPINALAALRSFQRELTNLQSGQVYFAHFLLPHMPYALAPDCSIRPISQWREQVRSQPLVERQNAYADQTLCVLRELKSVLESVERSPAGKNAIVIVHGDHGSRISDFHPLIENIGKFGDDDLIAGYSTLFAVRSPLIKPGYDQRHYPIVDLLREIATSNFRQAGSRPIANPTVILSDEAMIPRRSVPLPRDW